MADDVRLLAVIDANTKSFENALKRIERATNGTTQTIQRRFTGMERSLSRVGLTAFRGLAASLAGLIGARAVIKNFIDQTVEQEKVVAQLNATLASTGSVAGITAKELLGLASSLESLTTFDDEAIAGAEALLLTFTKVGRDIFPQATQTIIDMSVALGQDLKSSTIQVGKALQDPIKGITALRRVGVNFNEAQTALIKNLVRTGQSAQAQALTLRELQTEFGGSARAARETLGGALTSLSNAWNNLFEQTTSDNLRQAIEDLITAISDPEFKAFVELVGVSLFNALSDAATATTTLTGAITDLTHVDLGPLQSMVDIWKQVSDFSDRIDRFGGQLLSGNLKGFDNAVKTVHEDLAKTNEQLSATDRLKEALQKDPVKPVDLVAGPPVAVDDVIDPNTPAEAQNAVDRINRAFETIGEPVKKPRAPRTAIEEQFDAAGASGAGADSGRKAKIAAIDRQKKAVTDLIAKLQEEANLVGSSAVVQRTANEIRQAGAAATDEQKAHIAALVTQIDAEEQAIKRLDEFRDIAGGALSAFTDSLREGASLGDALKSSLDRVLDSLIQIAEQAAITRLFGAPGSSGTGLFGNLLGAFLHEGGPVGSAPRRSVPAASFIGAPRYRSGGMAGFRPGEIPAILHRGEIVLPNPRGLSSVASRQQPTIVQIAVDEGTLFRPTVVGLSGQVSVHTVKQNNRQIPGMIANRQARGVG